MKTYQGDVKITQENLQEWKEQGYIETEAKP